MGPFLDSSRFLELRFAALRSLSASFTPHTTLSVIHCMGPVLKIAIFFPDFLITLTRQLSWSSSSSAAAVEAGAACTGECGLAAAETMVTGVVGAAPLAM